jgi:hypothetical protein
MGTSLHESYRWRFIQSRLSLTLKCDCCDLDMNPVLQKLENFLDRRAENSLEWFSGPKYDLEDLTDTNITPHLAKKGTSSA